MIARQRAAEKTARQRAAEAMEEGLTQYRDGGDSEAEGGGEDGEAESGGGDGEAEGSGGDGEAAGGGGLQPRRRRLQGGPTTEAAVPRVSAEARTIRRSTMEALEVL